MPCPGDAQSESGRLPRQRITTGVTAGPIAPISRIPPLSYHIGSESFIPCPRDGQSKPRSVQRHTQEVQKRSRERPKRPQTRPNPPNRRTSKPMDRKSDAKGAPRAPTSSKMGPKRPTSESRDVPGGPKGATSDLKEVKKRAQELQK